MKGFNIIKLLKEYSTKSEILFAFRLLHNFRWESILNRMKNSGFLFIDKEEGVSSRRVDNLLRKKRGEKHVGHLGTLDPFASGLLIVAIGEVGQCTLAITRKLIQFPQRMVVPACYRTLKRLKIRVVLHYTYMFGFHRLLCLV